MYELFQAYLITSLSWQDRDDSAGSDASVKKRRGEESSEKHRSDKNGVEEKRKTSSSDRKR